MEREAKNVNSPERVADNYAADLLMPNYLFRPYIRSFSNLSFSTVDETAATFKCSYTATAIRLVESDEIPGFLICHGRFGRKWFTKSPSIPHHWFPKSDLDEHSHTFGMLYGGKPPNPSPYRISADAWFDVWGASELKVSEQAIRLDDCTLTLLAITDPKMFEDREENERKFR